MIHQKRRQELLSRLSKDAVVIVSTNSEQKRNSDVCYPFRPDSNFWYLTGFEEPDAIAVFSEKNYSVFVFYGHWVPRSRVTGAKVNNRHRTPRVAQPGLPLPDRHRAVPPSCRTAGLHEVVVRTVSCWQPRPDRHRSYRLCQ